MGFLFLLVLIGLGALYILSGRRKIHLGVNLDRKEYPLKDSFMPMGLLLLKLCHYPYNTTYDQRLIRQLGQLYGVQKAREYLKIIWAQKMGYGLLGLLLLSLLGALVGTPDFILLVFSLAVLAGLFSAPDYELKEKIKKRDTSICLDFPDFLNKVILLINAGLNLNKAWEKVALAHSKKTPLYQELDRVLQDIRCGHSEVEAYENFAKRCRSPEINKFASAVILNLRRGNDELAMILKLQAQECWDIRKQTIKRLGEEASTKLLLPMMLMLVAILAIVALPALLAMKGISG